MGKAVTFVCVIALGTLLLAETGEVTSSVNADENSSLDSSVTATSTSKQENFEQKTRAQKGDVRERKSNETAVESASESAAVEEISVTKTPKSPNNNRSVRRNDTISERESDRDGVEEIPTTKVPRPTNRKGEKNGRKPAGNVSSGGKGSGGPKRLNNGPGGKKKGRNTTEENFPANASSINVIARLIEDDDTDGIEPNKSVCSAPPQVEGAITPRLEGTEFAVGTAVAYSCNFGYVSRNSINHMSFCRYSEMTGRAQWTTPEIQCIPRSCGDPGYLNNGRRIGNLFTFPNKVEYECDEGYKLKGLRSRYCQAGGDWSGRLPTCEPIYCNVPPDPVNGRVRYSSLEYGTELRYECDAGYMVKKHEPRFCSEDGTWSNEEPECIEARCEAPQRPEYGSVKVLGELKVGTLATYSCDNGRRLVGATTTKCLMSGQWTFDAPQCLITCTVPFIQNGDMGRIRIRNTPWNSQEEFVKVYSGDEIESNEALFVRCKSGFSPEEHSNILKENPVQVTCIDGMWSRNLQCSRTSSCDGEPPPTRNGSPVVEQRTHGYAIWYRCAKSMTKLPGNVTCHFGTWIGNPPKCLDGPCYMRDLNFPGLVKPEQEYLESRENFDISCEYGYRRGNSKRKVTCNRGKWDIERNPCILDTQIEAEQLVSPKQTGRTADPMEVTHSVYVTPSNHQIPDTERSRECVCTYDYENNLVKAKIGDQTLRRGDTITQGRTVSIGCPSNNLILIWQNGFRFYGKINMTCNTCESWQSKDLPACFTSSDDYTVISTEEDFKFLPGGIVHLRRGQTARFICNSFSRQPQWNYGGRASLTVHATHRNVRRGLLFITYMDIVEADNDHSGHYACYAQDEYGRLTSSTLLELRVDEVYCPWFVPSNGLEIDYSNENKISSYATFSCPQNAKLVGPAISFCESTGTWSQIQPHCEFKDYVSCPRFPSSSDLEVKYSNHLSVGSIATFSCSSPDRNLIGSDISTCQDDGRWSNPSPSCSDYVSCPRFPPSSGLEVKYSKHLSVGSIATFSCSSPSRNLIGSDFSLCQDDGRWSNPSPSCSDPGCSIGDLSSSIPETVEPDMTGVEGEFVPSGSEMRLKCSDDSVLQGNAMVLCGEDGKWKLRGQYECVQGCVLNVNSSSQLLIHPVQDSYRFGEFVLLSCPPGKETSPNVERLMCLGNKWTDPLPVCKESKKSHQA